MGLSYVWISPEMEVQVRHPPGSFVGLCEWALGFMRALPEPKLEIPKYLDHRNFVWIYREEDSFSAPMNRAFLRAKIGAKSRLRRAS